LERRGNGIEPRFLYIFIVKTKMNVDRAR